MKAEARKDAKNLMRHGFIVELPCQTVGGYRLMFKSRALAHFRSSAGKTGMSKECTCTGRRLSSRGTAGNLISIPNTFINTLGIHYQKLLQTSLDKIHQFKLHVMN